MPTYDMTTERYAAPGGHTDLNSRIGWSYRKFLGSELKTLKDGTTPADGDTLKIFKLPKHAVVREVVTIVVDADANAITMDIGYTNDTNTSATAFETDAALNATGVTYSSDDQIFFENDNYFLTITPSDIASNMEDATEFIVGCRLDTMTGQKIDATLTAPV